jgi:hypothetical protein
MAGSPLPPISAATAGVIRRLGEEVAEISDPQIAAHQRIGQVTAIDTGTITATVAYGAGTNLVAIAGHHWLTGQQPAVNDYVMVLSQDGDNWIVGVMATTMAASGTLGALVTRTSDGTSFFAASTDTSVVWQSEVRDDGGLWSAGAPTLFTLPTTGWWAVGGQIHYSGNLSSDTHYRFATTIQLVAGPANLARTQAWHSISDEEFIHQVHTRQYFDAGDQVRLRGFQDTGSAMSILTSLGLASNHFYAYYEGPGA